MATASLQCSRLSCQLLSRSVDGSSRSEWVKASSFAQGKKLSLRLSQRSVAKASVTVAPTAQSEVSTEDRLQVESENAFRVAEVDAAEQKDFNAATVLSVADLAPGVRLLTIEAEISREFIPIDKAYTKPGQSVQVLLPGAEPVTAYVSSAPFPSESNWRVLYKLRGDIPSGTTKAPQFALSVKGPIELHVTEADHPSLYNLQPGAEIELGPFQSNGLDLRPIMFLSRFPTLLIFASGNGIAAARSLIEAKDVGSLYPGMRSEVRLFYSAPSPSAVAYKDSFALWESLNVKVRPTVDSKNGEEWDGLVGSFANAFDEDDLEYDPDLTGAVVFGDKKSNQDALEVLKDAGVDEKSILVWEA
eukprot:TRINITY_DN19018_c0_g1_i1.p1 TRINITY_DN19018_c0_g1~~TRINITY_DN19018_c0_g1_i1.p1  ORF type:complete len:360 (-),score=38.32 TRINITY_DN19018_c0_g1_i1:110-1189(-)